MTKMLLLFLVLLGSSQGQDQLAECSDSQMQEINSEFNQCAVQLEYQFEERKDAAQDDTVVEVSRITRRRRSFTQLIEVHLTCLNHQPTHDNIFAFNPD